MATNRQNSVELLIRARDETQRAIRSAKAGLDSFAAAQARTNAKRQQIAAMQKDVQDVATAYRAAADRANELGRKIADSKRPSRALRDEFAAVRTQVKGLRSDAIEAAAALGRTTGQVGRRGSFLQFDQAVGAKQAAAGVDRLSRAIALAAANQERLNRISNYERFARTAAGARTAETAIKSETAALNQNTAALGKNAQAARTQAAAQTDMAGRMVGRTATRKGAPLKLGLDELRPWQMQNLGYQINDVVSGLAMGQKPMQIFAQQAGQIAQLLPKTTAALLRMAPVIGLVTAALSPFISAWARAKGELDTLKEFDLLLTRSGNAASYSAPKLNEAAQAIDEYAGSLKEARAAVAEFVGDAVAPEYLERFGKTAQDVAKVLKIDVSDAAKKVGDAFTGNADAVLALDDELGFLTESERKHMLMLREQKRDADIRTQAFAKFEQKYGETAAKMKGPWSDILRDFGEAWKAFVDFVNFIDFGKAHRQINSLIANIQRLTRLLPGANKAGLENSKATYFRNADELEGLREQQAFFRRGNQGRDNVALRNRIALLEREQRTLSGLIRGYEEAERAAANVVDPADTTTRPPAPANQDKPKRDTEAERRAKAQAEFLKNLQAENAERRFQITMIDQEARERRVLEELRSKELEAAEVGLQLSREQRDEIRKTVEDLYDAERAYEAIRLIEDARLELAKARGEIESRDDFIARKIRDAGLYTSTLDEATGELIVRLTREGQEYSDILRTLYDINEATRQRQEAEKAVNDLVALRSTMQERIDFLDNSGQGVQADLLREQVIALDAEIVKAADHAIALLSALGGPEAERAIFTLQGIRDTAAGLGQTAIVSGKQINEMLAGGATDAFDQFAQSIAEGQNAIKSLGRAFLQFAADFLRQIAQMILKQTILNALQGDKKSPGGGIGGMIAGAIGSVFGIKRHSGGLINSFGRTAVPPQVFNTALRYHTGGIVGLKPNEVPIIGLRNEEMLTEDDPRHRFNGGLNPKGPGSVKVINVLDPADLLDRALGGDEGERIFFNFVRKNAGAIKAAIG